MENVVDMISKVGALVNNAFRRMGVDAHISERSDGFFELQRNDEPESPHTVLTSDFEAYRLMVERASGGCLAAQIAMLLHGQKISPQ